MTVVYVAGPMTGLPEFNYPAFNAASNELLRRGLIVLNPATNPKHQGGEVAWVWYMRHALAMVIRADALCLLPDWQKSKGANLEVQVAEALELDIRPLDDWLKVKVPA